MTVSAPAVLTVNAGSSSIKFALFGLPAGGDDGAGGAGGASVTPGRRLLSGQVDGLGIGGATHAAALDDILQRAAALPGVRVAAVGHRVVHGGTRFDAPVVVDNEAEAAIAALAPLAPLHQPHNLAGIRAARARLPGVPQVACFDTAFHRSMPELHQRFALPQALHDAGVRRYGFHGLSYEFVAARLRAQHPALAGGRVVVAHLGNGASMCALHGGRSVATTMSFSPLDGLTMGTRCGRIDPAVVQHLVEQRGMTLADAMRLLVEGSGLLGLSGLSADMRTLLASAEPAAGLAVAHFVETALREVAGLAAALRGIDGLVFTGGIGENAAPVRARIVEGLRWLGATLDAEANARTGGRVAGRIAGTDSRVEVLVVPTDEEAVIGGHAARAAVAGHAAV